jgi:magnesium transporter
MEERKRVLGESLATLLDQDKMQAALALLDGLHPADAAEILGSLTHEERLRVFSVWDAEESSDALLEMPEDGQVEVMQNLPSGVAVRIISEMPPDDAVDLLADLSEKTCEVYLSEMDPEKAGKLRRLLTHSEETAGGLMTPEAMRLSDKLKAGEVLDRLREAPENVEMIYYVYFQDDANRLTGVNSLRELIVADPEKPVKDIMHTNLITVRPTEDQERVAVLIDRYDLLAVPVADREGKLLGIVTVDDVMDVMEEEAKEDIYSLAGTWETEERKERYPFLASFLGRLPWVFIALALELFVAGGILRAFSDTMQKNIALVFFIPAILALGGTVSLQSATRMVVDITGEGEGGGRLGRSLAGEILIGMAIAVICGVVISLFAWSMEGDTGLGLVVGVAAACTVIFAAIIGSLLPLILKALGLDPAKASEPFLAVVMDIAALAIYFAVGAALI